MAKDLTGMRFGRWTVIKRAVGKSTKNSYWLCKCDCGNSSIVDRPGLIQGTSQSCGCYNVESLANRKKDFSGRRYGRLIVLYRNGQNRHGAAIWRCRCDCGNEKNVLGFNLTSGCTTSCGCFSIEGRIERATIHGMSKTKEYALQKNNKRRERVKELDASWSASMDAQLRVFFPRCVLCGGEENLATDHVIPLSAKYGLLPGNAVRLCRHCNSSKGYKLPSSMGDAGDILLMAAHQFKIYWENLVSNNV